jgi:hypothetical protein
MCCVFVKQAQLLDMFGVAQAHAHTQQAYGAAGTQPACFHQARKGRQMGRMGDALDGGLLEVRKFNFDE